jgi:hypothetical protein
MRRPRWWPGSSGAPASAANRLPRHVRGGVRPRRHACRGTESPTAQAHRARSLRDPHHDLHTTADPLFPLPGGSPFPARPGDQHPRPDRALAARPARGIALPLHPLAGRNPPANSGPRRDRPSRTLQPPGLASSPPRRVAALRRVRAPNSPPNHRRVLLARLRDTRVTWTAREARPSASAQSPAPLRTRRAFSVRSPPTRPWRSGVRNPFSRAR